MGGQEQAPREITRRDLFTWPFKTAKEGAGNLIKDLANSPDLLLFPPLFDDSGLLTSQGGLNILNGNIRVEEVETIEGLSGVKLAIPFQACLLRALAKPLSRLLGPPAFAYTYIREKQKEDGREPGDVTAIESAGFYGSVSLGLVSAGMSLCGDGPPPLEEGPFALEYEYRSLKEAQDDFYNVTLIRLSSDMSKRASDSGRNIEEKDRETINNFTKAFTHFAQLQLVQIPDVPTSAPKIRPLIQNGVESEREQLHEIELEGETMTVQLGKHLEMDEGSLYQRYNQKGKREFLLSYPVKNKDGETKLVIIFRKPSPEANWGKPQRRGDVDGVSLFQMWLPEQDLWQKIPTEDYGKVFGPGQLRVRDFSDLITGRDAGSDTTLEAVQETEQSGIDIDRFKDGGDSLLSFGSRFEYNGKGNIYEFLLRLAAKGVNVKSTAEVAPPGNHSPNDCVPLRIFKNPGPSSHAKTGKVEDITADISQEILLLYGVDFNTLIACRGTQIPIFDNSGGSTLNRVWEEKETGEVYYMIGNLQPVLTSGSDVLVGFPFKDAIFTQGPSWLQQFSNEHGDEIAAVLTVQGIRTIGPWIIRALPPMIALF